MPTPISISSSASVKFGGPAAGTVHGISATPIERVRRLISSPSALRATSGMPVSAAAPTGRVGRALDRHVVVRHHARDFSPGHFGSHCEIHHIAFVILDDEKHASAGVDGLRCLDHLV